MPLHSKSGGAAPLPRLETCSDRRPQRCCGPRSTRSRSFTAISVSSSQEDGRELVVWLRVRILNSLVFGLSTTVRAIRDSLRDADQSFSVSRRIIGSVSDSRASCSKVSSTEIDCVGRSGMTALSSTPRASSYRGHGYTWQTQKRGKVFTAIGLRASRTNEH
jgi:hypothetical protein